MSDRIRLVAAYCSLVAAQIVATAKRHEPRVWLLWAVGIVLLCTPLVVADPGILALALDPELVAVIVISSVALLRAFAVGVVGRAFPARVAVLRLRRRDHRAANRQASNGPGSRVS